MKTLLVKIEMESETDGQLVERIAELPFVLDVEVLEEIKK